MAAKKTTYASVRSQFQNKMNSYKTLCAQTTGGASKNRPSPTQLNTFSKWIDKGAVLQNVSNAQLNRWAGKAKNWTTGSAKTTLAGKWGKTTIKAVAPNKTGGFIVATSPTRKGKQFKFSS
jgi:hypothetical protein